MLAMRPEMLDYIIKSHGVSAEQPSLAQIRSACEDYEQSYEYGKQFTATQAWLSGPKSSNSQNHLRNQLHIYSDTKVQSNSQHVQSGMNAGKPRSAMAQLNSEGYSKNPLTRTAPKPDPKGKPAIRHGQKTDIKKVSCFNCGGPHYTKDCPLENWKAT